MLSVGVVPRSTRGPGKRKRLFLRGGGGAKREFPCRFFGFSLGLCCPHGHALRLHPLLRLRLRVAPW